MILRVLKVLIPLLLAIVHALSGAATPRPLLTDYTHTAWAEVDGAPSGATKFAQGPDGWLWIATPTGLYRFDGVRFERVDKVYGQALYSSNIMALAVAADGALWVGYRVGSVSVFRQDGSHTYMESDGLQPVGAMHIEIAPDGAVWVAMRDGLAVLKPGGQRFERLGSESGLPDMGIFQIMFARDGTTWIGTNTGAYFRRQGERRFSHAWPRVALVTLREAPDGTIWANDFSNGNYKVQRDAPPAGQPIKSALEGASVRFDRDGTMWVQHADSFERRVTLSAPGAADQRLLKPDRVSGTMRGPTFEDREGNLWIGTSRGIDRLRRNRLQTMPLDRQLEYPALVTGPDGEMWAGDYATDVWRYGPDGRIGMEVRGQITASYTAPDGTVWLGGLDGIKRRDRHGRVTVFGFPGEAQGLRVHAIQQDSAGDLWVSVASGKGVYKLVDGQWIKSGGVSGIPDLLITTMSLAADGGLWMAHPRGQITVVDKGKASKLGGDDSLHLGTILALQPDGKAMWVGAENGVALYRDGHFIPLRGERGEAFNGTSGIVRQPNGDLWMNGAEGLYRVAAADLNIWLKDPRASVTFEHFDARDGMQGHAPQWRPVPSLKRSADGLLWYATTSSIGVVDPAHILRNPLPPPVHIVGVSSEGNRYAIPDRAALNLPEGTQVVQIDFTALSLSIPERVRLRYRLIGLDRGWQEAAGRRQANYTNLPPGQYRFEVIASNEDNVWNTQGAVLHIDIPPTFVQSGWFKLLLALIGLLLLYAAYALRIHYITQRMQERLQERLTERTRIARALHDTLLQSMQALLMTFDAHSRHLKEGTQERVRLDQTLNLAEQLLVEGRDQIMDLRTTTSPEVLGLALEEFGKRLAEHRAHAFELSIVGKPKQLREKVHGEIYAIAREALFNASRYADASKIALELEYDVAAFAVRIRDNGRGLDESVAASGHRPGHWGLVGMRERAQALGATLHISSEQGAGTHITVTVAAITAYQDIGNLS